MIRRKATETKTVLPNFASGNVDVTPSANKTMTKVTIQKDSDLIASNVKKDVEIHGITGTYEGASGDYRVKFIYYAIESGVLVEKVEDKYVNAGGTVTAPSASSLAATSKSCALDFQGWNHTLTNIQMDMVIGAMYNPASDGGYVKTHVFIGVNAGTGLTATMYFNKSTGSELTISWGDGTSDYTTTSSGNLNTSHTYGTAGIYQIKMWISSGTGKYGFGNGNTSTRFLGGDNNDLPITMFIGSNVTNIGSESMRSKTLSILTISNSVTTVDSFGLRGMYALNSLIFPTSVTTLNSYTADSCPGLKYISMSNSVTSIGDYAFQNNIKLEYIQLSTGVTTLPQYILWTCYALKELTIPSNITSINNNNMVGYCYNLTKVRILGNITEFAFNSFYNCIKLESVTIPSAITTLGGQCFQGCYNLKKLTFPSTLSSIGSNTFRYCYSIEVYTFAGSTPPTLGSTTAFEGIAAQARIYVPSASVSAYKSATNWSTYANQIYADTPENRALFGD